MRNELYKQGGTAAHCLKVYMKLEVMKQSTQTAQQSSTQSEQSTVLTPGIR